MKICIVFPIRARAQKFLDVLAMYKNTCSKPSNVQVIINTDVDDESMTAEVASKAVSIFQNTTFHRNMPEGKIAACNANLEYIQEDVQIILLASDDMIPQVMGWDEVLVDEMKRHYPDTDGVLFHNEGYLQDKLNCMVIVGMAYFKRFGYLYHPDYISLWADNEMQDVANSLGKQTYFPLCLFKHQHYARTSTVQMDELMKHNESFYAVDAKTYQKRKSLGFPIEKINQ